MQQRAGTLLRAREKKTTSYSEKRDQYLTSGTPREAHNQNLKLKGSIRNEKREVALQKGANV